jgi:hypothetical protein
LVGPRLLALAFSNLLLDAEVPARLFELIRSHVDDKYRFLLLLNGLLLVLSWMSACGHCRDQSIGRTFALFLLKLALFFGPQCLEIVHDGFNLDGPEPVAEGGHG